MLLLKDYFSLESLAQSLLCFLEGKSMKVGRVKQVLIVDNEKIFLLSLRKGLKSEITHSPNKINEVCRCLII